MKSLYQKTLGGLRPVGECKGYPKIKLGDTIEIDIKIPRNMKLHGKFFALINLAFQNQDNYKDPDKLRKDLIKSAGYLHEETNYITGEVTYEADSISFASMDDIAFGNLYNAVLDQVWKFLGTSKEEVKDELLKFS